MNLIFSAFGMPTQYFSGTGGLKSVISANVFWNALKSIQCLVVVVKSDYFQEAADVIENFENMPVPSVKNIRKHFIVIISKVNQNLLQNKTYHSNVHIISSTQKGENGIAL